MDPFVIAIWVLTLVFLLFSFSKSKAKTKKALKMALGMGKNMLLSILSIVFAIGLIFTLISPEEIAAYIATHSPLLATFGGALIGTVTLVPAIIAFPLVGTLVDAGVHVVPSVAFLTTLTMVGIVTLPLEKKAFGRKFTVVRNSLSFVFAILVALVMGVIL